MIPQTYQHQHSISPYQEWGTCPKCGRYEWYLPDGDLIMWGCGYAAGVHRPDEHERHWGSYLSPEELAELRAANATLIERHHEIRRDLKYRGDYTGPTRQVLCAGTCHTMITVPTAVKGRLQQYCDECYYLRNLAMQKKRRARARGKVKG
jgi:hypothetical protein